MADEGKTAEQIAAETKAVADTAALAAKVKGETYTVKIDGTDKALTLDELKELASKSGGADKRFAEAAEIRKTAEKGVRVQELMTRLDTETPKQEDINEFAGLLGIDAAELTTSLKGSEGDKKKDDKGQTGDLITKDRLDPALKDVVTRSEQEQQRQIVAMIDGVCKTAVDRDEILGKIVAGYDEKNRPDIAETIKKIVFEDVQRKILAMEPYGPEMVADSVQRARATLQKFGIHNRATEQPLVMMGLGPSGVLPTEVQASEPIKRIAASETGYEDNLANRYFQKVIQAFRRK